MRLAIQCFCCLEKFITKICALELTLSPGVESKNLIRGKSFPKSFSLTLAHEVKFSVTVIEKLSHQITKILLIDALIDSH